MKRYKNNLFKPGGRSPSQKKPNHHSTGMNLPSQTPILDPLKDKEEEEEEGNEERNSR